MTRPYVTTRVAAQHLGIGTSTLQSWAAKGLVTPKWRTPGGQARWDIQDLERQLDMPPTATPTNEASYEPLNTPTTEATTPVRPPIAAAIVTSRRGVLIERRHDGRPLWTFPAGEAEPGESPADTAIREVKEETGLLVKVSHTIGERQHPMTGRHMIYLAARPYQGTAVLIGDLELAEVRWVTLAEAEQLLAEMYEPVHEHLMRTLRK
jgi:8-oxo-dGTP pyrophosphatase MutT (NUDIX family)